jgi:hypothetical protein
MNTQTPQIAARDALTDAALDIVSGGQEERHQVTFEEYERILGRMIAAAKKSKA